MKILLTVVTVLIVANSTNAQGLSAGLRTGLGGNADITKNNVEKYYSWNNELFTRAETKGRLAFEVNFGQYSYGYQYIPEHRLRFLPEVKETLLVRAKTNQIELGISTQYEITCKALKEKCLLFKHLDNYIGLNISAVRSTQEQVSTNRIFSDGSIYLSTNTTSPLYMLYTGISHTATYTFGKIYLTSTARLVVDPYELTSPLSNYYIPGYSNTRASLLVGAGYRF